MVKGSSEQRQGHRATTGPQACAAKGCHDRQRIGFRIKLLSPFSLFAFPRGNHPLKPLSTNKSSDRRFGRSRFDWPDVARWCIGFSRFFDARDNGSESSYISGFALKRRWQSGIVKVVSLVTTVHCAESLTPHDIRYSFRSRTSPS